MTPPRYQVVLTERAMTDLIEIGRHIARDSPIRADQFVDALEHKIRTLDLMPTAYPLVPGREESGIRRRLHRDHLIFFTISADRVVVLHVLSGAMDYEAIQFPAD